MDAGQTLAEPVAATPPALSAGELRRREEFIGAALRTAVAEAGEHRLFQSGKLAGLFPLRTGTSADAASEAVQRGLFEIMRTETRGKFAVDWVKATPRGVEHLHGHDSPRTVLHELKAALAASRAGVPGWLVETRDELDAVAARFEDRAREVLGKLDDLGRRLDAALRRMEAQGPNVPAAIAQLVPWAVDALEYLDRRLLAGAPAPCPLGELFTALRDRRPGLTIPEFHTGLRRLNDNRAGRLRNLDGHPADAEYALLVGRELCSFIER